MGNILCENTIIIRKFEPTRIDAPHIGYPREKFIFELCSNKK